MTIEPTGMILPDCECFKTKLKVMNGYIDRISTILMLEALNDADTISLCDKARDYYVAAIVWTMVAALIKKKDDHREKHMIGSDYRVEFEETWERLKPLVMQRIDYADGVVMEGRRK